jgi:hypothetical protein
VDYNNPAEVLSYWLDKAYTAGTTPPTSADKAWMQVWHLRNNLHGNRELMARAWALTDTTAEVRSRASALHAGDILLTAFGEVEETVANFVQVKTISHAAFFSPLKETGRMCLAQLTQFLAVDGHAPFELDDERDAISDLVTQTRSLIDSFRADTELPADLRRDVIDRLQEVIAHLLRVEVGGAPEVGRAIDGVAGVMLRIGLRSQAFLQHPLVGTMWKLCSGMALLVGMGADFHELTAAGGVGLLALPTGGTDVSGNGGAGGSGGGGSR